MSAKYLIRSRKIKFAEYGLPLKILSDGLTTFISHIFKTSYQKLHIEQGISSSYSNQSNSRSIHQICKENKNALKLVKT